LPYSLTGFPGYNPPPVNKAGTSPALTSPAASGVFLLLSASRCNRPAQAPPRPVAGGLPCALPLSPFRPVPPRLGQAAALCRPVRPCRPSAACDQGRRQAPSAGFPLPRAALCLAGASLPLAPCRPPAWSALAACPVQAPPPPRKGGNRRPPAAGAGSARRPPDEERRFTNQR